MSKNYYAVKEGRTIGIYNTWSECESEVKGYPGAKFKKFSSEKEAQDFIGIGKEDRALSQPLNIKEAIAYVDGSFDINTFNYSYGLVLIYEGEIETYSGKYNDELSSMRNVAGEIKGARVAMEKAIDKGIDRIYLHYDYKGIEEWALGRWKTNKEGTRAYKTYYDSIVDRLEVVFVKVKAHSGVEYNELADKLAKDAL